ncbi:MAG: redoxin domain-containing protein [Herpetosiphonaceae bacterium]|nr:redoxin domain-containing protein [Herpetosiphonaceae bacterium]
MPRTLDTIKLVDPDGAEIALPELWRERPVLLFLMRHLGCALCRRHLLSLRDEMARFAAAECAIAVIVMGDSTMARTLRDLYSLPFAVYGDTTLEVYDAFEFGQTSLWNVTGPHILVRQFALKRQGHEIAFSSLDSMRRLGGLVVIGPAGDMLYRYVANPIYRYPAWDAVLQSISLAQPA